MIYPYELSRAQHEQQHTLKSRTISDATAGRTRNRGLWRRAARRWQDVMITLEKDSHRQLAVMRARECIRKAKRPIPESRIDIHTVRKAADRTIQKWGYRRLLMKYGAITLIALTMTVINWRGNTIPAGVTRENIYRWWNITGPDGWWRALRPERPSMREGDTGAPANAGKRLDEIKKKQQERRKSNRLIKTSFASLSCFLC